MAEMQDSSQEIYRQAETRINMPGDIGPSFKWTTSVFMLHFIPPSNVEDVFIETVKIYTVFRMGSKSLKAV